MIETYRSRKWVLTDGGSNFRRESCTILTERKNTDLKIVNAVGWLGLEQESSQTLEYFQECTTQRRVHLTPTGSMLLIFADPLYLDQCGIVQWIHGLISLPHDTSVAVHGVERLWPNPVENPRYKRGIARLK